MSKKFKVYPGTKEVALAGIPPTSAIKHIPDWYKDIQPYANGDKKLKFPLESNTHNATMKRCVPFLDAMTAGYTFVLDDDVFVEQVGGVPLMRWKSDAEMITFHSFDQFEGLPIPKGYHNMVAKWHNDYLFKTPPGYSTWFTHPVNRFDLPFLTMNGFVDTDKYTMATQFPFFLQEGFEGIIESGTPVAQMIPIKRDSWEINVEKYDKEEMYKNHRAFRRTFAGSYKINFWNRKYYK